MIENMIEAEKVVKVLGEGAGQVDALEGIHQIGRASCRERV